MINIIKYIPIIIPIIIGYSTSMLCKMGKDAGESVKFRPPPAAFGIVWPILYILLGLSWYYARENSSNRIVTDIFYSMVILITSLWIIVYSCGKNKKGGIYVLISSFICGLWAYTSGNMTSKMLLCPLLGWILFATFLNITEVQNL